MNHFAAMTLLAAACVVMTGCDNHERSSAPLSSETREVDDFDSIEMEGAARLEITVGAPESVTVEAREDVIERVRTEVHGDTLHIKSKPKDWFISDGRPRVTVRITVPELQSLKLEGGNDVRLAGFAGGRTKIRAEGAAHIKAEGHVEELTVHMAGAGHADLSKLAANEAKVTVDGVGSVYVQPKESLDATMNGVGAILYVGSPREVNTRMNGLGTIGQRSAGDLPDESGHADGENVERDDAEPAPVDPDTLQPEYEEPKPSKLDTSDSTEVI